MVSTRFADRVRLRLTPLGRIVARTHLTPNTITVIGLILNVGVAAIIASGNLILGGVAVLFAGGFDALDGAVARVTGKTSTFGGFLDSTLDRYSEAVVFAGLLVYLTRTDADTIPILLTYATIVGFADDLLHARQGGADRRAWRCGVRSAAGAGRHPGAGAALLPAGLGVVGARDRDPDHRSASYPARLEVHP
jgi:hypothetical protein